MHHHLYLGCFHWPCWCQASLSLLLMQAHSRQNLRFHHRNSAVYHLWSIVISFNHSNETLGGHVIYRHVIYHWKAQETCILFSTFVWQSEAIGLDQKQRYKTIFYCCAPFWMYFQLHFRYYFRLHFRLNFRHYIKWHFRYYFRVHFQYYFRSHFPYYFYPKSWWAYWILVLCFIAFCHFSLCETGCLKDRFSFEE